MSALTASEYKQAMIDAKVEFDAWESDKRKTRKGSKAKYKAQRLAKLDAQKAKFFEDN